MPPATHTPTTTPPPAAIVSGASHYPAGVDLADVGGPYAPDAPVLAGWDGERVSALNAFAADCRTLADRIGALRNLVGFPRGVDLFDDLLGSLADAAGDADGTADGIADDARNGW